MSSCGRPRVRPRCALSRQAIEKVQRMNDLAVKIPPPIPKGAGQRLNEAIHKFDGLAHKKKPKH